jgi:hypothetical protein
VLAATDIPGKLKAGWTWGPNPAHSAYDLYKFETDANRKTAKCKSDGLVMIGYYKWIDNLAGEARIPEAIKAKRRDAQYIVSIMDLTPKHLGWLKAMRTQAMVFLKAKYDVDPADGDTVRMYFHWPTGYPTSTLHLHARVNWRMSPVEYIHSYTLDDIIAALEKKQTVAQMIAERYKRMGGVVIDGNFDAMTSDDPEAAPSGTLLNRFLRSVVGTSGSTSGRRVFSDAKPLPKDAFNMAKNIVRTAVVEGAGSGKRIYVQRPVGSEKSTNLVRADRLAPDAVWVADDPEQKLFTPEELRSLRLKGYRGTVTSVLSCLVPFFDNAHVEDCVKINADGTDLERYEGYDAFKAAMVCPPSSTCSVARVERSAEVNGTFTLWVSDKDWSDLKDVDLRKNKTFGYVDGNVVAESTFNVSSVGGKNIVSANPTRETPPPNADMRSYYAQDERVIAKWIGHWAMIATPK